MITGFDDRVPSGLPSIKERGGGGMIYGEAKDSLLQTLRTPRVSQPPSDKLLHNNRVFAYELHTARDKPTGPRAKYLEQKL